jgi:single-strand DNA-binding protein
MLNQVVLVGRLTEEVKEKNKKGFIITTLGVPRSWKNENGEYETDFIDIKINGTIADNVKEFCKKGDIVGVKGRIQTTIIKKDNKDIKVTEIVAEKVTFLSSKSES